MARVGLGLLAVKQHAEAAEALAKATTLAPERPEVWRGLGEAKAAWGATDEAIVAFERAVAMDDRDIASIVQVGLLQAEKGDLARAKSTLDRALALNPADVEALCGSAAVAQKAGRAKDAQAHAGQVNVTGGRVSQGGAGTAAHAGAGRRRQGAGNAGDRPPLNATTV